MLSTRLSFFLRAPLLIVALAVVGCQTAPVQEMSDARQAIAVARDAGAEEHAAADLGAAVQFLHSAEQLLNERKYDQARRDAVNAKNRALAALRRSEAGEERETP